MSKPTKKMLSVLSSIFQNEKVEGATKPQLTGLVNRGLLFEDYTITEKGRLLALERLSLKKQCSYLGIAIQEVDWDGSMEPEKWVAYHYEAQGFKASFCEGQAVANAIKALCLDALTRSSIFFGTEFSAREDACRKCISVLSHKSEDELANIIEEVLTTDRQTFIENCMEILFVQRFQDWCPTIKLEFLEGLYEVFTKAEYAELVKWFSLNPSHRNGWPDLTVLEGGGAGVVEVKTTDKLHESQLVAIPAIKSILGLNTHIIKLNKRTIEYEKKNDKGMER